MVAELLPGPINKAPSRCRGVFILQSSLLFFLQETFPLVVHNFGSESGAKAVKTQPPVSGLSSYLLTHKMLGKARQHLRALQFFGDFASISKLGLKRSTELYAKTFSITDKTIFSSYNFRWKAALQNILPRPFPGCCLNCRARTHFCVSRAIHFHSLRSRSGVMNN